MNNAIATSHPLAVQAGEQMFAQGGSAVDAAIAAAAVLTVVEPTGCGLGSDAFAQVWDGAKLHGLDASGPAPAAWTPEYFVNKYGPVDRVPQRGIDSVTVPGAVAAWSVLSARFGQLPFADLLQPAIDLAQNGHEIRRSWDIREYYKHPGFVDVFSRRGRVPQPGETFQLPAIARGLAAIAGTHGQAFYTGEIADALVKFSQQHGGAISVEDLKHYQPEWVTPITQNYQGYTVHELPPRGQGIAALMALGMLEHFDLEDNTLGTHLQIEAVKLAFADLHQYIAQPSSITVQQLLDPVYLKQRAGLIDPDHAQDFGAGNPVLADTVLVIAADVSGQMISFIQSNSYGFGSGCVEPTYGISLQNRGHAFRVNDVVPGQRPFHTIIPAFVFENGQPVMSFGVVGGNMQPQAHVQCLVRVLKYKQSVQAACAASRWRFDQGLEIAVEPGVDAADLQRRGHVINNTNSNFGVAQFVWRDSKYTAVSDERWL
jgi:gamma-glutamyltranspeptidase/glutathione hydrolase